MMKNGFLIIETFLARYSGLCRMVQSLTNIMKQMDAADPFRIQMTDMLLEKL